MNAHRTTLSPLVWQITDDAAAILDRYLAEPVPEHGAALMAPTGTRLITHILVDPLPGAAAAYRHSDQLAEELNAFLSRHPELRYVGTTHSHPGGFAQPSRQDHNALRATMRANPDLRDGFFPIVVQYHPDDLDVGYRCDNTIALPHGALAGFTGYPVGGRMLVQPCRVAVLPLRADLTSALADTGSTAGPMSIVRGIGTAWLMVDVTASDTVGGTQTVLFPQSYPESAPLIRGVDQQRFVTARWDIDAAPADRLAIALKAHGLGDADAARRACTSTSSPATEPGGSVSSGLDAPVDRLRAGLEARLAYHLPDRGDWTVAVVGCGSVGSTAAELLVRSGIRRLTLIDPDQVAPENLSRSVYRVTDIDTPKVTALAERLLSIAPDLLLSERAEPLRDAPRELLPSADLVILAADDPASEAWLSHLLYHTGVPHVSIKMYAKGDAGEIVIVVPDAGTPCLGCATGRRGHTGKLGSVNYGSGRLEGELALGPDIVAVTARGVKVALAVLSRRGDGPLADWVAPLLTAQRTLHLAASVAGWGIFEHVAQAPMDGPFAGLWVRTARSDDCLVCGTDRVAPAEPLAGAEIPGDPDELLAGDERDWRELLEPAATLSTERN